MKIIKKSTPVKEEKGKVVDIATVRAKKKVDTSEIDSIVEEYNALSQQSKTLEKRKKELADKIKEYALVHGSKDDKGSYYCENSSFVFGRQSASSIVEKPDIINTLKAKGWNDCIDTVEIVNRIIIDKKHDEGIITDADLKELFEVKEGTPRVYVKAKEKEENMPEIKMSKVAKRKGKK